MPTNGFGSRSSDVDKKRESLRASLEKRILPLFEGRILPLDAGASEAYAELVAPGKVGEKFGAPVTGHIAAIAKARGFIVATQGARPFEAVGLSVLDPWKS